MAKWAGDKHKTEEPTGLEKERPDFESTGEGNQTDARVALMNKIADNADDIRREDLRDVSAEDYEDGAELSAQEKQELKNLRDNPGGKTFPRDGAELHADEEGEEQKETEQETEEQAPAKEARTFKLKINGVEQEVTEDELIARAQKVGNADQYMAEAAKLYAEAKNPVHPSAKKDDDTKEEEDFLAIARAIQMGSEDEAVEAIKRLKSTQRLSTDDVGKLVDQRFEQRSVLQRDQQRFTTEYKDLLADDNVRELVYDLDEAYNTRGEPPTYDRFKKAAEAVKKTLGNRVADTSMADKEQRKQSVRVVTGSSARPAPREQEKEPTTGDVIASMAKARGQFVSRGGN